MYTAAIPAFDPIAIAESGQCFRMRPQKDGSAMLVALGRWLAIRPMGEEQFEFSCDEEEYRQIWRPYFDLDADYALYRARILKKDAFLQRAAEYGKGLRILRQDPFEMLVTFILSQRKSIPAICTAVEKLCQSFGKDIDTPQGTMYAFPTPQALAGADFSQLQHCGLGYRTKYVQDAARQVAEGGLDLAALEVSSDETLCRALKGVFGVGEKVAACVMLFGYHRLGALPLDVWMNRVIEQEYGGNWPRSYRAFAGVIQQYMFYYARCPECAYLKQTPADETGK